MAGTRYYKSWSTNDYTSSYVPSYRREVYTGGYNSNYNYNRPVYSGAYRSWRDTSAAPAGGSKFDFVSGRYSTSNHASSLRDSKEPAYYRQITDLILSTNKLQEDYRDILGRHNDRERCSGYGSGLPQGYGGPKYSCPGRLPPVERYGLYDRRKHYGNREYDTDPSMQIETEFPHRERAKGVDYQGSVGGVHYAKDMHKGTFNPHDPGHTARDLDLDDPHYHERQHERAQYGHGGTGRPGGSPPGGRGSPRGYGRDPRDYDPSNRSGGRGYDILGLDTGDRYGGPGGRPYGSSRDPYGSGGDPTGRDRDTTGRDRDGLGYDNGGAVPGGRDRHAPGHRDGSGPRGEYGPADRDGLGSRDRDGLGYSPGDNSRYGPGGRDGRGPAGRNGNGPDGGYGPGDHGRYGPDGYGPGGKDGRGPGNSNGYGPGGLDGPDGHGPRDRDGYGPGDRDGYGPGDRDRYGPGDRDGRGPHDQNGYGPDGRGGPDDRARRGGGLKKSPSRGGIGDLGKSGDSGSYEDDFLPIVEFDDIAAVESAPVRLPTPEPSKCVFNEITPEEFNKMEEERKTEEEEESKKEKPLCDYPLVATVTSQVVQVDKIVGQFNKPADPDTDEPVSLSPLPGMSSVYVTSPHITPNISRQSSRNPGGDPLFSLDMNTTDNGDAMAAEAKEIKLEFDESPDIPFGVTAKTIRLSEETVTTETTEEIHTTIHAGDAPSEVHLVLEDVLPEGEEVTITAKPVPEQPKPAEIPAPEPSTEITMKQAAKTEEPAKVVTNGSPVSLKMDSDAAEIISKNTAKDAFSVAAVKSDAPAPETKKEEKTISPAPPTKEVSKVSEEKPASPKKAPGKSSKFGDTKGKEVAPPAGAPKKKKLW